jgi:hypothetical protein
MDHCHAAAPQNVGVGAPDAAAHARAAAGLAPAGAAAGLAPTGAAAGLPTAGAATTGVDACLAAPLAAGISSPSATATASARAADLVPFGLGLPDYPACTGALTGLLSPTRIPRQPPPGFSTTRPLVADAT